MMEARLPPGFRFHPRDEELVCDYLSKKVAGDGNGCPMMIDVDLNKCEPWDLPEMACLDGKEWYFFSLRDRKYATGQRTNRATLSGYWKATGKDRPVARRGVLVGMRKTLVFYQGRAPKGRKTDWVMHEFRMEGPADPFKEDWALCRVFYKSRGNSSKSSMETCYDDTGSSALPPLTDTYIASNQTPQILQGYEQVPCFSNFPLNPASHHMNQVAAPPILVAERSLPIKSSSHLGGLPHLGSSLNPLPCDKRVIKAVLNHLTKLEGNQKREAPPTSAEVGLESYFCGTGQPSMWSTF